MFRMFLDSHDSGVLLSYRLLSPDRTLIASNSKPDSTLTHIQLLKGQSDGKWSLELEYEYD